MFLKALRSPLVFVPGATPYDDWSASTIQGRGRLSGADHGPLAGSAWELQEAGTGVGPLAMEMCRTVLTPNDLSAHPT